MKITYRTNNSGGGWWLDDSQWQALEDIGWVVDWKKDPWLGALATEAYREDVTLSYAIDEWQETTGLYAYAEGCDCCGRPHNFYEED
jgi:hypothetical protein